MDDHLNSIEVLVTWSRAVLDVHGASCVGPGCRARGRAEAALVALREALATRETALPPAGARDRREPRQARLL